MAEHQVARYAQLACYWSLGVALAMYFVSLSFVSALAAFVYFGIGGFWRDVGGLLLSGNAIACGYMPIRMWREHRENSND